MSASFNLTLDTVTHVAAQINDGQQQTDTDLVSLELALDADAVEVKVWGSISLLDPGSAGMGESEEEAEWLPAKELWKIRLSDGPGVKVLHVLARDDVWNEAAAAASIVVSGEPEPPPRVPPPEPHGRPARRRPRRQLIASRSRLRVSSSPQVHALGTAREGVRISSRAETRAAFHRQERVQLSSRSRFRMTHTHQAHARLKSAAVIHRRGEGDEIQAAVALLL